MKMIFSLVLLMAVVPWHLVTPFEIPKDCLVRDEILEENPVFDSLEFFLFNCNMTDPKINFFIIGDDDKVISLELTPTNISVKNSSGLNEVYSFKTELKGWQKLQLGLRGNLSLQGEDHQQWLPSNLSLNSAVKRVKITNGKFTRMCPMGTPTWVVEGREGIEIPLQENLLQEKRQNLSLFSLTSFSPTFNISGKTLQLKTDLMGLQRLVLDVKKEDNKYKLQVSSDEEDVLDSITLDEFPSRLNIRGRKKDNFLLTQYINGRVYGTTTSGGSPFPLALSLTGGGMVMLTIVFLVLLICHCRTLRKVKTGNPPPSVNQQQRGNGPSRENGTFPVAAEPRHGLDSTSRLMGASTAHLLHPTPIPSGPSSSSSSSFIPYRPHLPDLPPPLPLTSPANGFHCQEGIRLHHEEHSSDDGQDDVYCEMEPILGVIPANSFAVGDSGDCVETINDIYVSAD